MGISLIEAVEYSVRHNLSKGLICDAIVGPVVRKAEGVKDPSQVAVQIRVMKNKFKVLLEPFVAMSNIAISAVKNKKLAKIAYRGSGAKRRPSVNQ